MTAPPVPPAFPVACVADASVLTELFSSEQDSDLATSLFTAASTVQVIRIVPDLIYLECANIFRTSVHHGLLTRAEARGLAARLATLPLSWYPTPTLLTAILDHALVCEISAYDAAYVAPADVLRVPLISADAVLVRKRRGARLSVRDLVDCR